MERIAAAIWNGFLAIVNSIVGRVLAALGVGVGGFQGLQTSMDWLKGQAVAAFHTLPPDILNLMATLKVGVCFNMFVSAILIKLTLKGLSADVLKMWIFK